MRFNSKELCSLLQRSTQFDKEGYLLMKDKQDGLFKKSEVYMSRYLKLKGNLLFYLKAKDVKQEPLGVIILERCAVELDVQDTIPFGFSLVFEGEEQAFHFGADNEVQRDKWIQALHIASHECLKMQLQSLREQLHNKTGIDPVPVPQNSSVDFESHSEYASEDPVLEISLACTNLPNDGNDTPPNSLIVVHTMLPPQQQLWMHLNHTEIVEKSNNPQFLKTIGFGDKFGIDTSTRVRLSVHHVVERMTGTMSQVGNAMFTLQDILRSPDLCLTTKLKSSDMKEEGEVTITAWINDERVSLAELQAHQGGSYNKRPRSVSLGRHSHNLQAHYSKVMKRAFRFSTNDEKNVLQVSEYMGESNWTFELPIQLLRLWINEEKQMISMLQDFGELPFDNGFVRQETSDFCMSMVSIYNQHVAHLSDYEGETFKASVDKSKQELEFIPVNLHIERMVVSSGVGQKGEIYDMMTSGAFVAHYRGLKRGGLLSLLHQKRQSYIPDRLSQQNRMQRACSSLNEATELRKSLKESCEKLKSLAQSEDFVSINSLLGTMKENMHKLNALCSSPIIQMAAESYISAKRNANSSEGSDLSSLSKMKNVENNKEVGWKWSGSQFVKSPTIEPWEVTRLNLEAAFVCLFSVLEELSLQRAKAHETEQTTANVFVRDVFPALTKLQSFLEVIWARISLFLTFLCVMEDKGDVKSAHDLKLRRDIVNAHAITSLVSAFAAVTQTDIMSDPHFTKQLSSVGILFQCESLLSCFKAEMNMLEDHIVGIEDLRFVSLRLVSSEDDFTPKAELGGFVKDGIYSDITRHNIIVDIPIPKDVFFKLPKELQHGKVIKVTPICFNVGINEQATLAEKFGSTATQDKLNMDSFARLYEYYTAYCKHFDDPLDKSLGKDSLNHMIKILQSNVMTKKSKNVEILQGAQWVTRALKGLRLTNCKSGKDRTAMAVTLEMIHILQRNHDLASHVFVQSLDCIRSVGCRRENTEKNTGVSKYAFVSLQLLYIPKLYRPPSGTYGSVIT